MFDPFLIFIIIVYAPFIIISIATSFPFVERNPLRYNLPIGVIAAVICVFIVGLIIGIYTSETLMWLFFLVVMGIGKLIDINNGSCSSESKIDEKPLSKIDKKALLKSIRRKKNRRKSQRRKNQIRN